MENFAMKKLSAILIFCAFAFAQNKPPCPDPFTGKGEGKNEKAAVINANEIIAIKVKSSVKIESSITRSQREIDGVPEDTAWASEKVKIVAELENAGIKDLAPLARLANGQYEIERYLCPENAAKPFLNSLRRLSDKLSVSANKRADKEQCKAIAKIYYEIKDLEGFLENLGQMDSNAKSKYELVYAKAKEKCDVAVSQDARPSLMVSVSGYNHGEFRELLLSQMQGCNCNITENKSEADFSAAVKTNFSRCNKAAFDEIYCWVNATLAVSNAKSKKTVNAKMDAKGGWTDGNRDMAIEEAFKELAEILAEKINQTINQ